MHILDIGIIMDMMNIGINYEQRIIHIPTMEVLKRLLSTIQTILC